MTSDKKKRQLWVGLVEVRLTKRSKLLKRARGAFVDIVTWATDADQFSKNAEIVLGKLGLVIVNVESPQPVTLRRRNLVKAGRKLGEELEDMIGRARVNRNAIIYGTFHMWGRSVGLE